MKSFSDITKQFEFGEQQEGANTRQSLANIGIQHSQPLAEVLRPKTFDFFYGQEAALKKISVFLKNKTVPNLVLWGPPGSGKTTLAHLIANQLETQKYFLNATDTSTKDLKKIGETAHQYFLQNRRKVFVFLDEIHRFSRSQQDVLLPFLEKGTFYFVGATTENPGYELNSALLSRCQVVSLKPLTQKDLRNILSEASQRHSLKLNDLLMEDAQELLLQSSLGDARLLLNQFERVIANFTQNTDEANPDEQALTKDQLIDVLGETLLPHDKDRDQHHDLISAFIKSIRGSDPNAGLYYLARMLKGGEDPLFIARRLIILASEDIGNADPRALTLAVSTFQAVEFIGLPEGRIPLAQCVTYLSAAPKSNKSYLGINAALAEVDKTGPVPVPLSLRSAQTAFAQSFDYGKDYQYSHEGKKGFIPQKFLPQELKDPIFYEPGDRGFEKTMKQYLEWMKEKNS
ncbi:MAG: replication-associated recombination protein A [Pseudobdellovibrionaceae bacterium]